MERTHLSLHGEPLEDLVLGVHIRVIFSKPPVNKFIGLVLVLMFLEKSIFSLRRRRVFIFLTHTHHTHNQVK